MILCVTPTSISISFGLRLKFVYQIGQPCDTFVMLLNLVFVDLETILSVFGSLPEVHIFQKSKPILEPMH